MIFTRGRPTVTCDPDQPFAKCAKASFTKLKADIACDTAWRGRVAVVPTLETLGKSR
jgi:hypothetical protein